MSLRLSNILAVSALLVGGAFLLNADHPASAQAACSGDPTNIVVNGNTAVCGNVVGGGNVYAYQGIQYATADRWANPTATPWPASTPVPQKSFGPVCYQALPNTSPLNQSENCLYLNVWAPKAAINGQQKLPVMVFIHGGAFIEGAGSAPIYDGTSFASQGVVLVTLNYRLGAFGFLAADNVPTSPGAKTQQNITGNFGLMDQQMAMQWVKANIANFGGDPNQVTLFGESAGAMSVGLHNFTMPSSSGLFQAAIMESNPMANTYRGRPEAANEGSRFIQQVCSTVYPSQKCQPGISWLTDPAVVSPTVILEAQAVVEQQLQSSLTVVGSFSLPWSPILDGVVKGQPYAGYVSGTKAVPLAFGVNANEGTVFTAFAYNQFPGYFTPAAYDAFLSYKFGILHMAQIKAKAQYQVNNQPQPTPAYMNQTAFALANVMTDYGFVCGNIAGANNAGTSQPVYGYQFTQAPIFDLYNTAAGPMPACLPGTAVAGTDVCHANELPYVFNTLLAAPITNPPVPPADRTLAAAMNAAWAAFAKNPSSPGSAWTKYTAFDSVKKTGGVVGVWNSSTNGQPNATTPLATNANCQIFLNTSPYKAAS